MGTLRKPLLKFKEQGIQARKEGKQRYDCPQGLTHTQHAYWQLGWEQQRDQENDQNTS